jgi:hypothetical protein
VTTGITDEAGNHLERSARWPFTIVPNGIDQWRPIWLVNAPAPLLYRLAAWTGSEIMIWGGASDPTEAGAV